MTCCCAPVSICGVPSWRHYSRPSISYKGHCTKPLRGSSLIKLRVFNFIGLWQPSGMSLWSDNTIARRCAVALWRWSSHEGVVNEPTSPSHDRGHANPQPDTEHPTCICRTGRPVRLPFWQIARPSRAGPRALGNRSILCDPRRSDMKAAGRTGGRPPKLTDDDIEAAKAMLANPDIAVTQIAHRLGVSTATLYRYIPAARTANTPSVYNVRPSVGDYSVNSIL